MQEFKKLLLKNIQIFKCNNLICKMNYNLNTNLISLIYEALFNNANSNISIYSLLSTIEK